MAKVTGGDLHNEFACIQTKQIFPLLVPGSRIHGQPLTMNHKSSICKLVLILDCYWFCPWTYLKHETRLQWSSVWAFTESLGIKNYSVNMMILGFLITPIWSEMPEPINVDHSVLKGLPLQFLSIVTKLLKLILILCPLMERLLHCLSARRLWVWIQASPHSPKTCLSAQALILIWL